MENSSVWKSVESRYVFEYCSLKQLQWKHYSVNKKLSQTSNEQFCVSLATSPARPLVCKRPRYRCDKLLDLKIWKCLFNHMQRINPLWHVNGLNQLISEKHFHELFPKKNYFHSENQPICKNLPVENKLSQSNSKKNYWRHTKNSKYCCDKIRDPGKSIW